MKKLLLTAFILVIGLMRASPAQASSVIFAPNVLTPQAGATFVLPILVDPLNSKQYTVGLHITYPPALLEVTSFSFGQSWLALAQPGYDSVDNVRGELIKTGGFPGGFASPVPFGTITFRSKAAGNGTVAVGAQSFILNADSNNTLATRPQAQVVASGQAVTNAPPNVPVPALPTTGTRTISTKISALIASSTEVPGLPSTGIATTGVSLTPQEVPKSTGGSGFMIFIAILIAALLIGTIGRVVYVNNRRRSFKDRIKQDEDQRN